MWVKYYSNALEERGNWGEIDYNKAVAGEYEDIDLVYSPKPQVSRIGNINGSIYHIVQVLSDKVKLNKLLLESTEIKDKSYLPRMEFFSSDKVIRGSDKFKQKIQALGDASNWIEWFIKGDPQIKSDEGFNVDSIVDQINLGVMALNQTSKGDPNIFSAILKDLPTIWKRLDFQDLLLREDIEELADRSRHHRIQIDNR
jgi:hypothetical protein